ncbi:hypothetical protein PFICI_09558 [Pestalotiopsis fici W106-1]|uniref:AAA+ ATPase domain-containing protein n=1 Tax=Pestalotiopsis fici (strain W106-1 / CGMCC3.15140) TaxID=1229662 RepID=W3X0T0_PESFW|nr:uncharacterized protein PFICI_09558 [Pestalotiopsis fici W106-1]ETS79705.1 hypothetical protein PFICI_09558 [Pestalotiopsis fici W106-1]
MPSATIDCSGNQGIASKHAPSPSIPAMWSQNQQQQSLVQEEHKYDEQESTQEAQRLIRHALFDEDSKFQELITFVDSANNTNGHNTSFTSWDQTRQQYLEAFMNAPIFTLGVGRLIQSDTEDATMDVIPQFGLMGIRLDAQEAFPKDRLVLANMNTPWSAFICGSQGAGKSHTLSCLLESYIDSKSGTGSLPKPLAGMIMHYDNFTNDTTTQLCEAAYLCSAGIPVKVLVCPSNIWTMKRLYRGLRGLAPNSNQPKVMPLYLTTNQLNISRILKLMAVDPSSDKTPLYMEVVMNIVRQMAMEGPKFTYHEFRRRLSEIKWAPAQEGPLKMRLQLLDTFLAPSPLTEYTRPAQADEDIWAFAPGSVTIVDLSDPFVASDDACALFSICLSIFMEDRGTCGRVVAVDEAHKFLVQTGEARVLTNDLISVIRQQRHTGTRVIIATQDPTLSPELIELSNATFVHRFLSPRWYEILKRHLAAATDQDSQAPGTLLDTIVNLGIGEALLFCPTAQLDTQVNGIGQEVPKTLGKRYVKLQIRKRVTTDGGRSITSMELAPEKKEDTDEEVPMHIVAKVGTKIEGKANPVKDKAVIVNGKVDVVKDKAVSVNKPPKIMPTKKQTKKAARSQVEEKGQKGWGLLENLQPLQRRQLYSDAETSLNAIVGILSSHSHVGLRAAFDEEYDIRMTSYLAR